MFCKRCYADLQQAADHDYLYDLRCLPLFLPILFRYTVLMNA